MENDSQSNSDELTSSNKSLSLVPTSTDSYNTTVTPGDTTTAYWSYNVLGRRLLFRPLFKPEYKDAEDYYQKSYDPLTGIRVAAALGGLMLFICGIAVYNRYGFFRKRRRLHVSLRNSQEQLEGIEWLKVIGFHETSLAMAYNPVCSDQDLPKSPLRADGRAERATTVKDRLIVENESTQYRRLSTEHRALTISSVVVASSVKRTKTVSYKQPIPRLRRANSF